MLHQYEICSPSWYSNSCVKVFRSRNSDQKLLYFPLYICKNMLISLCLSHTSFRRAVHLSAKLRCIIPEEKLRPISGSIFEALLLRQSYYARLSAHFPKIARIEAKGEGGSSDTWTLVRQTVALDGLSY